MLRRHLLAICSGLRTAFAGSSGIGREVILAAFPSASWPLRCLQAAPTVEGTLAHLLLPWEMLYIKASFDGVLSAVSLFVIEEEF